MTMAAAEAAGGSTAAGSAAGEGASSGALAQVLGKALGREPSKGTMLALAILFFWLAGVLFFVAFEGSGILGENAPVSGSGGVSYIQAIFAGLRAKAAGLAGGGQSSPSGQGG